MASELAGGTVSAWAFTATGVVLALAVVGWWWWAQRREARAFALASVRAADELADLAQHVDDAPEPVLERFATARTQVEQATTTAELAVARHTIAEAFSLLWSGEPLARVSRRPPAIARPASKSDVIRLIVITAVSALLVGAPIGEVFGDVRDEVPTFFATHAAPVYAILLGGYLLTRHPQDARWRTGRVVAVGAILLSAMAILVLHDAEDAVAWPALGVLAVVAGVVFWAVRRPPRLTSAGATGVFVLGVVIVGYTVAAGLVVEESATPPVMIAAAYVGYGLFGALAACGLFVVLTNPARDRRATEVAARRANAYSDLLRAAVTVSTSDSPELPALTARYLDAKDAFERGDYDRVSELTGQAARPRHDA